MSEEHWSSPNGCHPDCPACEEEMTDEEREAAEKKKMLERAAPDLLAACRGWEAVFRQHGAYISPLVMTALKATMAAIAKAEGESVDTSPT